MKSLHHQNSGASNGHHSQSTRLPSLMGSLPIPRASACKPSPSKSPYLSARPSLFQPSHHVASLSPGLSPSTSQRRVAVIPRTRPSMATTSQSPPPRSLINRSISTDGHRQQQTTKSRSVANHRSPVGRNHGENYGGGPPTDLSQQLAKCKWRQFQFIELINEYNTFTVLTVALCRLCRAQSSAEASTVVWIVWLVPTWCTRWISTNNSGFSSVSGEKLYHGDFWQKDLHCYLFKRKIPTSFVLSLVR